MCLVSYPYPDTHMLMNIFITILYILTMAESSTDCSVLVSWTLLEDEGTCLRGEEDFIGLAMVASGGGTMSSAGTNLSSEATTSTSGSTSLEGVGS